MLKRLLLGLVLGTLVGGALAAALVKGLGLITFAGALGPVAAYGAAALVGVLTGLVAGKAIWSTGGKIEAGLKAFFGALLAAGAMFALRRWAGGVAVDLSALGAGHGALGDLPAASLPMVAAALGAFFEVDNTPEAPEEAGAGRRVSTDRVRVDAADPLAEDDEEDAPARARSKSGKDR